MNKLAVIALGGNAILRSNELGKVEEQEENIANTLRHLMFLVKEGYNLVLTHGNGPQVGNLLMQNDAGEQLYGISPMPLDVCVASSQGEIGYMIERMLRNVLHENHIEKDILTIVTQVVVDINDKAYQAPLKRVGKIYLKEEADILTQKKGWIFKENPKTLNGWSRVVPSPMPLDVFNKKTIEQTARAGAIVIAAGGGGIPVYYDEKGIVRTADSVIDKDLASSLLANCINADEFYILTDVPVVYLDFGKPTQMPLFQLTAVQARKLLSEGKFGEGTMAPKIEAAIRFVENGGNLCVITESGKLYESHIGTKITK